MLHTIIKMGLFLFCLGAGVPGIHTAPHLLAAGPGDNLSLRQNTHLQWTAPLSLEETYTPGSLLQEEEHGTAEAEESVPVQPAQLEPAAGPASAREDTQSSGFPYNTLMILAGLSLLAFPYLHGRIKATIRDNKTDSLSLSDDCITVHVPESPSPCKSDSPEIKKASSGPVKTGRKTAAPDQGQDIGNAPSFGEIRRRAKQEGKVDVGHLLYLLESAGSYYTHSRALYLLGKYRIREALPMILRDMANPDPWVRVAAASALVNLKSNVVEERMIEMAESNDSRVRNTAVLVLSRIGTSRAYEVLRKSIWDFEPEVREAAALAIGRLQVPNAEFDVRQALSDFEENVRKRAAWAENRIKQSLQGQG